MKYKHTPVLLREVLEQLSPRLGQIYFDGTLGGAGYTLALAELVGSSGRVLGNDLDPLAVKNAEELIKEKKIKNIKISHDNFKNIKSIIRREKEFFNRVAMEDRGKEDIELDGVVFDLGLSSAQLEDEERGFSFKASSSLDMGFGPEAKDIARIINNFSAAELARIFKEYGEEKFAYLIGRRLEKWRVERGEIKTAAELAELVREAMPKRSFSKIHPATKVFQALRIFANRELENLREALPAAVSALKVGGRLAIVSYHSLEDRIVKNYFKEEARGCSCPPKFPVCRCGRLPRLKILTKKAIVPSAEEIEKNPRSRSAKLRVAEKI